LTPEEAVPAYHNVLQKLGVRPHRSLADDMTLQTAVMSYGGSGQVSVPVEVKGDGAGRKPEGNGTPSAAAAVDAAPNFKTMSPAERLAYHQARLKKQFGG
ncbi:MAG: hypothetical protein SFV23_23650, partial [Planctomycetaceae bacterium]|nr:hypothetical protein [Planctomycetaceae bacterium]